MGFIGLLRLIAIILCIYLVLRFLNRKSLNNNVNNNQTQVEDTHMVECLHCRTHVPLAQAIKANTTEGWYCCSEHLEQSESES